MRKRPSCSCHARRVLAALLLSALAGAGSAQSTRLGHNRFCPPALEDAAGTGCVGVSSVPTAGFLLPLGQDFFVSTLGDVGLGTTSPAVRLDVRGAGGNDSTLRLQNTGTSGASGILLQRPGGTPVDWSISYDSGARRDLLIHDNVVAKTRLKIDSFGTVSCSSLDVGDANEGLQFRPHSSGVSIDYGPPGANSSALLDIEPQKVKFWRTAELTSGARMGAFSSLRFDEDDTFASSPPMIHMFTDGTTNFDRMVLAHSDAFDDWGLRYDDDEDAFHFLGGGNGVMTIDLSSSQGKVGIEDSTPQNILTIQQNSPTDPVADAWTTYSSRRWKEDIATIEDALDIVRRLRGVTYAWKATGEADLGMIAEEVGEVLPQLVAYEENGVDAQSIDYARLTAVLVEAVKEQDELLAAQADELRSQGRAIEELIARVTALETSTP